MPSLKKILGHKAAPRSSGLSLNPAREWLVGLLIAFTLLALGAAYATYLFWSHLDEDSEMSMSESGVVEYRKEAIQLILEHFKDRAAEFELLRGDTDAESLPLETKAQDSAEVSGEGTLGAE